MPDPRRGEFARKAAEALIVFLAPFVRLGTAIAARLVPTE